MALKFYASVRVKLERIAQIKKGDLVTGSRVRAKIVKNKVAAPFKTAEFDIYWNEGISRNADIINTGLKYEVVKKSGNTMYFNEVKLGAGLDTARALLGEDKKLAQDIRKAILEKAKEVDK